MRKHFGRSYLIDMLIGLAMAIGVFSIRGGFSILDWQPLAAALCDACFVPGIILLCVAMLVFVSNDGLFDMLNYGVRKALQIVMTEKQRAKYPKTFYDYRKAKWETSKGAFGHLVAAGTTYMIFAVVFLLCSGTI